MGPECSFCDSAAVRESGPDKLVTCYDCHTAYSRGHDEGIRIGEQRATARLRPVLLRLEWLKDGYDDHLYCPVCYSGKKRGHTNECALGAALRGDHIEHTTAQGGDGEGK